MTPTETEAVRVIVREKWPRVKWAEGEWDDFSAGLANLSLDVEQVRAALGHLKRTSEKYPTVAGLLKAIVAATPARSRREPEERADQPEGPEYTLARWARMLGLPTDTPRGELVRAWYADAFARSVRLRGCVRESSIANAHKDLIELAGYSSDEADAWCYETNAKAEEYANRIETPKLKARWENTKRMDRIGLAAIVKRKADEAARQEAAA